MKKVYVCGIKADSYGISLQSFGLEAIIFNPQDISPERVQDLPGVYLHPIQEANDLEIFALRGTKEQ